MADTSYRPNARWEPGGVIPLEGTPAQSTAYTTYIFPSSQTTTGTAQQFYGYGPLDPQPLQGPNNYIQERLAAQQQAQAYWDEYMRQWQQFYMYGNATFKTSWDEPKPLETKALTDADKRELEESLPW